MSGADKQKEIFEFFNEIAIINQLATALFNQRLPNGLHLSHFSVINHLMRMGDGQTPLHISRAMQVTKATMTHTLGVLEKHKFIEIKENPKDGRSKLVFLTLNGTQFMQKAVGSLAPLFELLGRECDIDELQEILPTLSKLRQVLDDNRDE